MTRLTARDLAPIPPMWVAGFTLNGRATVAEAVAWWQEQERMEQTAITNTKEPA